jgi:hypothetical protein
VWRGNAVEMKHVARIPCLSAWGPGCGWASAQHPKNLTLHSPIPVSKEILTDISIATSARTLFLDDAHPLQRTDPTSSLASARRITSAQKHSQAFVMYAEIISAVAPGGILE